MYRLLAAFMLMACMAPCVLAQLLSPYGPAPEATEESIVLDPVTGNYIIIYRAYGPEGQFYRVVFVPATKIEPVVKSRFTLTEQRNIRYAYKVKNGRNGKQPLIGLSLLASNVIQTSQLIPAGWRAGIAPNIVDTMYGVYWSYADLKEDESAGLLPGQSQSGFSIDSPDLPGIDMAELNGATPILALPGEGPEPDTEVGEKLDQLTDNNFVTRPAAAPLIPVPSPFNAAAVLESLQKHVKTWVGLSLLDAALAAQLDARFQSTLTALQSGNTSAARLYLKDLRQFIKQSRADAEDEDEEGTEAETKSDKDKLKSNALIDKLAAKVLMFDVKYLEKRLGANE